MINRVNPQRIVVVGAGHVGLYAALRLSKKLNARRAEVVVIDPQPHMTYQPFLPEAAAGNISPAARGRAAAARAEEVPDRLRRGGHPDRARPQDGDDPADRRARPPRWRYDHIIVAPGSVSRTLPVPGLRENAASASRPSARPSTCATTSWTGWTSRPSPRIPRDAQGVADLRLRRRRLTPASRRWRRWRTSSSDALKYYSELKSGDEVRFVLVEATNRILPEVGPRDGRVRGPPARRPRHRPAPGHPPGVVRRRRPSVLSDGDELPAPRPWSGRPASSRRRCWTRTDLPRGPRGHVTCLPEPADRRRRPGARRRVECRRLRPGA